MVAAYSMILEQNAWRIDDISYRWADGSKNTLRNQFEEPALMAPLRLVQSGGLAVDKSEY